jgi:predicted nucleotidyltransferase
MTLYGSRVSLSLKISRNRQKNLEGEKAIALTKKEQRALNEYRNLLLRRFPGQMERLVLFGSKARGEATPGSDVDVLVVLDREW